MQIETKMISTTEFFWEIPSKYFATGWIEFVYSTKFPQVIGTPCEIPVADLEGYILALQQIHAFLLKAEVIKASEVKPVNWKYSLVIRLSQVLLVIMAAWWIYQLAGWLGGIIGRYF